MDLKELPEHQALRAEVRDFIASQRHLAPSGRALHDPQARAWQQMLIAKGYAARTIPRDYGGAGLAPDILATRLIADTFGAAQAMLAQAVAYAGQRQQFGRVIGSFQAVKHLCADMAAALEPCRAFVWYTGHALGEALPDAHLLACQLKAHLCEVGQQVAKSATEVRSGMGFTDLLGLHYWFKRIGANRQLLGSPERLRLEAAQAQGLAA